MKKCMYTVNVGGYDNPPFPPKNNSSWDKILFTDKPRGQLTGWDKIIKVDCLDRPDLVSRKYKWLSHKLLPEYDLVCYFDANMRISKPLTGKAFRIKHGKRNNVREEADACNRQIHRWTIAAIEEEMKFFESEGFPDKSGLFLNGFFCRDHSPEENALCEMVWDILNKYTSRDQIALPFAMWKLGYQNKNTVNFNPFFVSNIHLSYHKILKPTIYGEVGEINVHHITPARSDKNFGKAINDIIKNLPDNDWVCLRDIDTLPLDHASFITQCEDIAKDGSYQLVSCMTNRLGLKWQLLDGKISDNTDISKDINIAKELSEKYGSLVEKAPREIAGLMMLFPKKVWDDVGGFKEGGIIFGNQLLDNIFYRDVVKKGYKVGIAKGIYLFHLYRWGKDRKDKKHLEIATA